MVEGADAGVTERNTTINSMSAPKWNRVNPHVLQSPGPQPSQVEATVRHCFLALACTMSGGYELHQKLRTKAVRQLKKKDYDGAIKTLYEGSRQLLEAKEQGSGCDLACYLVDVYSQASKPSTEESRQRVIALLDLAEADFWRKKVIDATVKWSTAVTGTPAGDGFLRLAIAEILSKGAGGGLPGGGARNDV